MTKKGFLIILAVALMAAAVPCVSSAQNANGSPVSLPGPVNDFLNALNNIKVGTPDINNTGGTGQNLLGLSGGNVSLGSLGGIWENINNWFRTNAGVSFTDIIKAVVNLIIWVWEIIIKLLQVGLSHLQ